MTAILAVVVLAQIAVATPSEERPIPTCKTVELAPEIEERILPVLSGLVKAREEGDWYLPEYTGALHDLLREQSAVASEARIALLAYYVGEAYGEELVCAVSSDGASVLPLLEDYRRCRPQVALDPVPLALRASTFKYDVVREMLRNGEACDLHL